MQGSGGKMRGLTRNHTQEDIPLLSLIGATDWSDVEGQPGRIMAMFRGEESDPPPATSLSIAELAGDRANLLFPGVPKAYLSALQFACHDIALPMVLSPDHSYPPIPPGLEQANPGVVNARCGTLSLGSVYGTSGLTGDLTRTLQTCLASPWDPAKLAVGHNYSNGSGDLLRLHSVIVGGGSSLPESYFNGLAPHLRAGFFEGGEIRMNRAIVPDIRNDTCLFLSQFHFAVVRFHNRAVDCHVASNGFISDRSRLFHLARVQTLRAFASLLRGDVLPRLCDPRIVDHVIQQGASFYRRSAREHDHPPFLPAEALAIFGGIAALQEPVAIYPNLRAKDEQRLLSWSDIVTSGLAEGLPRGIFVSPKVPTRLAERNCIDWDLFLDTTGIANGRCTCDGGDETIPTEFVPRLRAALDLGFAARVPSAQACIRDANAVLPLGIAELSPDEVAAILGLADCVTDQNQETPLLVYVVAEARAAGKNGRLGPLGSLILAETLIGAAEYAVNEFDFNHAFAEAASPSLANFLRGGPGRVAQ